MFKHILAPSDGSELSKQAAQAAAQLAKTMNAALTAVHVMPMFSATVYPEAVMFNAATQEQFDHETELEADRALAIVGSEAQRAGLAFKAVKNRYLHVYDGILAAAKENACDLIVMASHGRRGVRALVLGSETNKVLTHSKIPVLVYR